MQKRPRGRPPTPSDTVAIPARDGTFLISLSNAPGVFAVVDAVDVPRVLARRWRMVTSDAGRRYAISGRLLPMHRFIMGSPPGVEVDHRDGDGLLNVRRNLRKATHAQNMRNRRKRTATASRFKGVRRVGKRWYAEIRLDNVRQYLGSFVSETAAAEAYDQAARVLHGEFACPNVP